MSVFRNSPNITSIHMSSCVSNDPSENRSWFSFDEITCAGCDLIGTDPGQDYFGHSSNIRASLENYVSEALALRTAQFHTLYEYTRDLPPRPLLSDVFRDMALVFILSVIRLIF